MDYVKGTFEKLNIIDRRRLFLNCNKEFFEDLIEVTKERLIKFLSPIPLERLLSYYSKTSENYRFVKFLIEPHISIKIEKLEGTGIITVNDFLITSEIVEDNIDLYLFNILDIWRFSDLNAKETRRYLLKGTNWTVKDFKLWIEVMKSKPY